MAQNSTDTPTESQPGLTEPLQERSRRSLEKLLEAARQVVSERGFEEASVADIVARSGLSVGAFYQRFENKAALLGMVHCRYTEKVLGRIQQSGADRFEGRPIAFVLRTIIEIGVRNSDRDGGFQTACYRRALTDPDFAAREARVRRALTQQLVEIFEVRSDEIRHPDPRIAADFVVRLIASMTTDRFQVRDAGSLFEFSAERMTSELLDTCLRYIGAETLRRKDAGTDDD